MLSTEDPQSHPLLLGGQCPEEGEGCFTRLLECSLPRQGRRISLSPLGRWVNWAQSGLSVFSEQHVIRRSARELHPACTLQGPGLTWAAPPSLLPPVVSAASVACGSADTLFHSAAWRARPQTQSQPLAPRPGHLEVCAPAPSSLAAAQVPGPAEVPTLLEACETPPRPCRLVIAVWSDQKESAGPRGLSH